MSRPYMGVGIAQLEEMFDSSSTDPVILKQLAGELKHRQVPRAVRLLARVQAALVGDSAEAAMGGAPLPERAPRPTGAPLQPVAPPPVAPPPALSPPVLPMAALLTAAALRPGAQLRQPELWPLPGSAKAATKLSEPTPTTAAAASAGSGHVEAHPHATAGGKLAPPAAPDAASAYLLLKASPGTPWESVEKARRQLVDAAHPSCLAALPPEKRAQAQAAARRANAAYAVLHALRTTTD